MVTQEDVNRMKYINHMVPKITIAMHKIATQIEDETLPWYLVNTFIDTDTGEFLKYKYIMTSKEKKLDTSGKTDCLSKL